MNTDLTILVGKALELGATDARLMDTASVVFDDRAFLKCRFGCGRWGRYWSCPPHIGISADEFKVFLSKYGRAIMLKCKDPKLGQEIAVALEKYAMLHMGCTYAFALALCVLCEDCAYPEPCRFPHMARPSMDGLGVDIGKTVEPLGLEVEFDSAGILLPSRYTMVLID